MKWLLPVILSLAMLIASSRPNHATDSNPNSSAKQQDGHTAKAPAKPNTPRISIPEGPTPETSPSKASKNERPDFPAPNDRPNVSIVDRPDVRIATLPAVSVNKDRLDKTLIVFTIIFSFLLVVVGFLQFCILYKMLHSDRPFLVVESFTLKNFVPFSKADKTTFAPLIGSFRVRNYGKGPGFIDRIFTRLVVVKALPKPRDFTYCEPWLIIGKDVIGPNDTSEQIDTLLSPADNPQIPYEERLIHLSDAEFQAITDKTRTLIIYGVVTYKDTYYKRYETDFCWICAPPKPRTTDMGGYFISGPHTHNRRT